MVREIWWQSGSARVALAIMGVVITLGAIVWAVAVVGTPGRARSRELDRARIEDLFEIRLAIDEFYREQGSLPRNLPELDLEADQLKDPQTGEMYGYVVEDAMRYRISARFSLPDDKPLYRYGPNWKHGSGIQEFSFAVGEKQKRSR